MSDNYFRSVERSLHKFYGASTPLLLSTRKDKKFMVIAPNGKRVHFGQMGYDDWHSHKDQIRRDRFLQRNNRWKNAAKWTPAHLAYYVLWN